MFYFLDLLFYIINAYNLNNSFIIKRENLLFALLSTFRFHVHCIFTILHCIRKKYVASVYFYILA